MPLRREPLDERILIVTLPMALLLMLLLLLLLLILLLRRWHQLCIRAFVPLLKGRMLAVSRFNSSERARRWCIWVLSTDQ